MSASGFKESAAQSVDYVSTSNYGLVYLKFFKDDVALIFRPDSQGAKDFAAHHKNFINRGARGDTVTINKAKVDDFLLTATDEPALTNYIRERIIRSPPAPEEGSEAKIPIKEKISISTSSGMGISLPSSSSSSSSSASALFPPRQPITANLSYVSARNTLLFAYATNHKDQEKVRVIIENFQHQLNTINNTNDPTFSNKQHLSNAIKTFESQMAPYKKNAYRHRAIGIFIIAVCTIMGKVRNLTQLLAFFLYLFIVLQKFVACRVSQGGRFPLRFP
jgi:hypothetical protein